jgi:hypothetical protein
LFKYSHVAILAVGLAGLVQSATIGNGPPNQTGGSDLNGFLEADKFVVAAPLSITNIQFWSLQVDPTDYAGSTYWAIYTNAAGSPGSAVASATPVLTGVADGNTTQGLNEFAYSFPVNVSLTSGTYWLVLHNGPTNAQPSTTFYWAWQLDSGTSKSMDLSVPGSPWAGNDANLAYQLTVTPEPASICLVGSGLLAAFLARRKLIGRTQ